MKLQLVLAVLMCASAFAAKSRYDNYKLFSLTLENVEQVKLLQNLEINSDSYDFWSSPDMGREVDILVPPHKRGEFENVLTTFNIKFTIKNENIQEYGRSEIISFRVASHFNRLIFKYLGLSTPKIEK